jgi:integrase
MKGVYLQPRSPYYWIRIYDKSQPIASKRPQSLPTKIRATARDLAEYKASRSENRRPVYRGNAAILSLLKQVRNEVVIKNIEEKVNITIQRQKTFMQAFNEMLATRSIIHSKSYLKPGTLLIYKGAANHFINACGNHFLSVYSLACNNQLLSYCNKLNHSRTYISILTRTLKTCFSHFIKNGWCTFNPIEVTRGEKKTPVVIPPHDLDTILAHFKASPFIHNYYFIRFLQLTGCRPSSAMVQLISQINFSSGIITITNVKTVTTKDTASYQFPIYPALSDLLLAIIAYNKSTAAKYPNPSGRLFPQFSYNEHHYNDSLKFFTRGIHTLLGKSLKKKDSKSKDSPAVNPKIERAYTLKHLRSTFASNLVNNSNLNSLVIMGLLDHGDIKTTASHYTKVNLDKARVALSTPDSSTT